MNDNIFKFTKIKKRNVWISNEEEGLFGIIILRDDGVFETRLLNHNTNIHLPYLDCAYDTLDSAKYAINKHLEKML